MNFFNQHLTVLMLLLLACFASGAGASDLVFKKVEPQKTTDEEKIKNHFQSLSSSLGQMPSFPVLSGQIQLPLGDAEEVSSAGREKSG